ncbi:hypothetical protein [Bacillus kwashiorkori]|uniref:hypothetical protein n=1 Tax=Bacillus kwashiorkori TaxID=1522318 RepID=UPI0007809DF7|nr:hypothetical protein [Bacillus kwashiorkori]
MIPIAKQPYVKVTRKIDELDLKQKVVEEIRMMYLFLEKITTAYREFPIEAVYDMSFKPIGPVGGILYLHTNHNVYSYTVNESPKDFIDAFKNIKSCGNGGC